MTLSKNKMTALSQDDYHALLEAILNTAADGIITIDDKGHIESFNSAAERIFGYKSSKLIGVNVSKLMPAPYAKSHNTYLRNYLRTGEAKIIGIGRETVGRRSNGEIFPIDLAVSEVRIGKRRMFTGIVRDISERKRLQKALVDATELERKQIGQDLHDTVSQQLAGLTMIAQALQNKLNVGSDDSVLDASKDAAQISKLALTALTQIKTISQGLYPVELERNGIGLALEQLAYQQEDLFGIPCRYEGETRLPLPDRTVTVHLYRIAQEAVSNAIKHAAPSLITIRFERNREGLLLSITDDGKGFKRPRKSLSGLGLAIMQYRANMIGSELEIHSVKGKGTVVACKLSREQKQAKHDRKTKRKD